MFKRTDANVENVVAKATVAGDQNRVIRQDHQ